MLKLMVVGYFIYLNILKGKVGESSNVNYWKEMNTQITPSSSNGKRKISFA
jgi:hypothetical protein